MPTHARRLPDLEDTPLVTDGGLETDLIFNRGFDLPHFAACVLLDRADGVAALREYFAGYVAIARRHGAGVLLETPTWRAAPDWAEPLGRSPEELDGMNRRAVDLLAAIREDSPDVRPFLVSGCIGPRGDGYRPDRRLDAEAAAAYHRRQIAALRDAGADLVGALTMTHATEAAGIAVAARECGIPVVISFTVETDGRLPGGESLPDAIALVEDVAPDAVAWFMVNCAHPTHFRDVLDAGAGWVHRIRGVRANASEKSHAELDEATELDAGDPAALGRLYRELRDRLPRLAVIGGCCGTDHRHVSAMCASLLA